MILNGIEITPESLKAQLEEQGFIVTEKPKPTVVWQRIEIEGDGPVQCWSYAGKTIPDELIQALESLYIELRGSDVVFKANDNGRLFDALKKVNDIKSRTAGT